MAAGTVMTKEPPAGFSDVMARKPVPVPLAPPFSSITLRFLEAGLTWDFVTEPTAVEPLSRNCPDFELRPAAILGVAALFATVFFLATIFRLSKKSDNI
jgi:hypothetical protein